MFLSFASWRRWWWLALVVFAASACQADFEVLVTVNPDGSGTVSTKTTFDDAAAEAILDLDLDATGVVLDDLAQSGWLVVPPEEGPNGSTVITATKDFGTADQFADVMAELTGTDGVFRDFRLTRSKTFARVAYEITGDLDTTVGIDVFGDPELETTLERTVSEIADAYGATEEQVDVRLQVVLPGGLQGEAPTGIVDSEPDQVRAEWAVSLADDEVVPVALGSSTRNVTPLVLRGVAGLVAVLAALVVFAQVLRVLLPDRRRRPRRKQGPKPKAPVVAGPPEAATGDPLVTPPQKETEPPYRVVAIDAMGVLYREADDISTLLIPFIRERSTLTLSDDEIEAKARALSLGRLTTGQFWTLVGVPGEATALDSAYLAHHQLMPGVIKYLRAQRARGVQVACVTNNAAAWSQALKANHDLEGLVHPWVVSGSVGARKPDNAIFEVLRRVTGEPSEKILVLDDDLDMLDIAREQGFVTAWFAPDGLGDDARGHKLIRNFDTAIEDPAESEVGVRAEPAPKAGD